MQAAELIKYIENPRSLTKQSVAELQKLVNDFPYFQSAHLLLSLASKKWDASVYQQSLRKTAIVATNRARLFNLVSRLEEQAETTPPVLEEEVRVVEPAPVIENTELDILKATEVSEEQARAQTIEPEAKPQITPEEVLEKEIQNQVVNAFVEKELLDTPGLNRSKPREAESFVEWLSLLKKNNGQSLRQAQEDLMPEKPRQKTSRAREEQPAQDNTPSQSKKEKNRAIIDKIIESSPGIIRSKEDQKFFAAEIKAKESLLENEHLVTETLARIYALQGSVNKAVRAYEILSLKYPQKSAYFATLIEKLKHNQ